MTNPSTLQPLPLILNQLKACGETPFEQARPIPGAVHHSQAFLDHECQAVFMKEWICIGREDELSQPGDYLTHHIAQVPVLVVKQDDQSLGAFVNACAHRFACLVPEKKGRTKRFTCRYHAWTYDLDGALLRAPYMDMKDDFRRQDHHLRPLRLAIWEGFIYVTLCDDPQLAPPQQRLSPLTNKVVGQFDMARYQSVLRESMTWKANWKNLVENFIESYHVPIAHGQTFAQHNKPLTDYRCGEDHEHYCYHLAPQPGETGPGAAHRDNKTLVGEWRRMMVDFCVFPCHLVTLMPDYLWYITVQPNGTDEMIATWGVAIPPENLADIPDQEKSDWIEQFKRYIDIANGEDKTLVEALHIGSRTPTLPSGTFHPIERNLWQFNRYLSRMCC